MTIQIPNPGTGNGASGDNEFVLWTKVKDNFTDQTNAASRLVGVATGKVPLAENVNELAYNIPKLNVANSVDALENNGKGFNAYLDLYAHANVTTPKSDSGNNRLWQVRYDRYNDVYSSQFAINYKLGQYWFRVKSIAEWQPWREIYHSGNTTKESSTGYLVASSPVLNVQHDGFEKIHEAEQLDVEVKNIKTGVYEIVGTTGLREGDGWNLKPPKDVNGNVLCVCEASEKDGVITLNTYAKRFDFETVSIVADYDKPINIPEGATVMLRFNDLPLDDFQTEV